MYALAHQFHSIEENRKTSAELQDFSKYIHRDCTSKTGLPIITDFCVYVQTLKKVLYYNKLYAMKNRNLGVMKDDRKLKLFVSIALFCFIYILFAFRPLEKELHLTPDWTVSVSKVNASAYESSLIPFKLGQSIGYFTEEGKVSSCVTYGFNSSISSDYYATYNADNTVTEVKTPDGLTAGKINAAGFPFFEDNRIYVFMPNGSSVARYEVSGEKLWEYESFAPITAFSSTAGGAAIGFADGHVVSVRDNGTIDQEYYPGGSAVPVILGVGISNDGNLLGCVSGQKKHSVLTLILHIIIIWAVWA